MTREELDKKTFDSTINDTNTESFEVDTSRAEDIVILLDDGTTGNTPASYDMTVKVYSNKVNDYQFYDEVTGETSRALGEVAWGDKMKFEFTNKSGSNANYRITILVYRGLN